MASADPSANTTYITARGALILIPILQALFFLSGVFLILGSAKITKGKVMPGIIFFMPIGWFLHMFSEDLKLQKIKEVFEGKLEPALLDSFPTRTEFWFHGGPDSLILVMIYATLLGLPTWAIYRFKNKKREPGEVVNASVAASLSKNHLHD